MNDIKIVDTKVVKCDKGRQNTQEPCEELVIETDLSQQNNLPLLNPIHVFSVGITEVVPLSEISNLFESHFKRRDLLDSVTQALQISLGTYTTDELTIVETGQTCSDALGKYNNLCVRRRDVGRMLQYTSALLDKSPPNVTWLPMGEFHATISSKEHTRKGNVSVTMSSGLSSAALAPVTEDSTDVKEIEESTDSVDMEANANCPTLNMNCSTEAEATLNTNSANARCVIRTCLLDGEEIVCIPDLHKTVIDLFGQSVQVGNYMHRLKIPTHRFSSNCLKHLKAHNILSSKATLCTYITKTDAERLLEMYHLGGHYEGQDDSFPNIEWSEPIVLENSVNQGNMKGCLKQTRSIVDTQHIDQDRVLKVPLFVINNQVMVSMPDVHKAVQLVNGQSVQLRYNLDKLGITKHKFSYSEVHHLKILGHLNRPSSCTYITKTDVDRLLHYYVSYTPVGESKLKLIEWQTPVTAGEIPSVTAIERRPGAEREFIYSEITDKNDADDSGAENYSISDLYKVFVGDDLENTSSDSNDSSHEKTKQQVSCLPSAHGSVPPVSTPLCSSTITPATGNDKVSTGDNQMNFVRSDASTTKQQCDVSAVNQTDVNFSQTVTSNPMKSGILCTSSGIAFGSVPVDRGGHVQVSRMFAPLQSSPSGTNSNSSFASQIPTSFVRVEQIPSTCLTSTSCGGCSLKRSSDQTWNELQVKNYRAEDEEFSKTLQRKETEMKILHDAYQDQIKQGREQRLSMQQELDQLRDSNAELIKSIERKELEMKILHDSYQLQMEQERKKCEELEKELLVLRGKVGVEHE